MNDEKSVKLSLLLSNKGVGRKKLLYLWEAGFNEIRFSSKALDEHKEMLEREKITVISWRDKRYPRQLFDLKDYPLLLFCRGNIELLKYDMVGIVGTRSITGYGKRIVKDFFSFCGERVAFVSGLAYGVDCLVHKTALDNNIATTAVVAGGIDKGYPAGNRKVYGAIGEKGLLISEFPAGRDLTKGMFLLRNRIIAGLCRNTIVVEGGIGSGALYTAKTALDIRRGVYTFPCDIFKKASGGYNELLKIGARPVTRSEDLSGVLGGDAGGQKNINFDRQVVNCIIEKSTKNTSIRDFLNCLEFGQVFTINDVMQACGEVKIESHDIMIVLTKIEMQGILGHINNKYFLKRKEK